MITEQFKDVPGFYGRYKVSNLGNILSVGNRHNGNKDRILHQFEGTYPYVTLHDNGHDLNMYVPYLVLSAFDSDFDGEHMYHIDRNTSNNSLANLACGYRPLGDNWLPVPDTNNIVWVSDIGQVYVHTHKYKAGNRTHLHIEGMLSLHEDIGGYSFVDIATFPNLRMVHRIVASAFLDNPDGKLTVNHIDGNKKNNSVRNLEWATHKEQTAHAYRTNLRSLDKDIEKCHLMSAKNSKSVRCKNDGKEFNSLEEAGRHYGLSGECIRLCIKQGKWTRRRLSFEYVNASDIERSHHSSHLVAIHKGDDETAVSYDELDEWVSQGWERGFSSSRSSNISKGQSRYIYVIDGLQFYGSVSAANYLQSKGYSISESTVTSIANGHRSKKYPELDGNITRVSIK